MDVVELNRLRKKAADRRDRVIAEAECAYRDAIKAIEAVWILSNDGVQPDTNGHLSNGDEVIVTQVAGTTTLVRRAIRELPERFTMPDIYAVIQSHHPGLQVEKVAISSALNKLWKQREVVQEVAGTGKTPAIYRKPVNLGEAERDLPAIAGVTTED